jgi:hypothetical protein
LSRLYGSVCAGLEILSHTTGFYNASFDDFESDCFECDCIESDGCEVKQSFAVPEVLKKTTHQCGPREALRNPMLYGHRMPVKNKAQKWMLIHFPGVFSPTLWYPVETFLPAPAQFGCACAPGALYSPEAVGIVITESM